MRGERTQWWPNSRQRRTHDYPWGRALGRETLDTLLLAQARRPGRMCSSPAAVRTKARPALALRASRRRFRAAWSPARRGAIAAHGSWESLPSERRAQPGPPWPQTCWPSRPIFARRDWPGCCRCCRSRRLWWHGPGRWRLTTWPAAFAGTIWKPGGAHRRAQCRRGG